MAFIETRLLDCIAFHPTGGPGWNTTVNQVESGQEYRNQSWSQSLRKYEIGYVPRVASLAADINSAFLVAAGRANGFRLKDWTDYAATMSEGVFTLLTSTTFQMWKRYTFGASTHDRKIQKPVNGTFTHTGGTVSSVDYTTGIVTMTSGTPTAWAGQFDVPVRFDTDELKSEIVDRSSELLIAYNAIPIVEIRV